MKNMSFAHISAGFVAVLVGYTSAAAIVFQAAAAGGADAAHIASWLWALGIGMGISGIGLSLRYRHPIIIAWSTPGAALLVTSLPGIAASDAVGAFLFSSLLITLCGITGSFAKIMEIVPRNLASAMLAGVLLSFGLKIFPAFRDAPLLVGVMMATYLLGKWRRSSYAVPLTFLAGTIIAFAQGQLIGFTLDFPLTIPEVIWPSFSPLVLIGVGLPLFVVTMTSQNIPGLAVLRAHGYQTPASPLITISGLCGMIFAVFGGFAYNLAAITAALCMSEDVDKDPAKRYWAAVWCGIFYIIVGLFASSVVLLFAAFPKALVAAIAGLALLGTIAGSLKDALSDDSARDAAILTFAITASNVAFLDIGAPFWGLVAGLIAHHLLKPRARLGL